MVTKKMTCKVTSKQIWLLYARNHNPLLIRNRSGILTIHKSRNFLKILLEKLFLNFKKWVKNTQTTGYNVARTVFIFYRKFTMKIIWNSLNWKKEKVIKHYLFENTLIILISSNGFHHRQSRHSRHSLTYPHHMQPGDEVL